MWLFAVVFTRCVSLLLVCGQGGTVCSALHLIREVGGVVVGVLVVIELNDLGGRARIAKDSGLAQEDIISLFAY